MKVTIELTESQSAALSGLGIDTTKGVQEFVALGANNKLKGAVMGALKRVVVDGESQYKALSAHMNLPVTCAEYISLASKKYYQLASALGGRSMKPLDDIIREILSGESAVTSDE